MRSCRFAVAHMRPSLALHSVLCIAPSPVMTGRFIEPAVQIELDENAFHEPGMQLELGRLAHRDFDSGVCMCSPKDLLIYL